MVMFNSYKLYMTRGAFFPHPSRLAGALWGEVVVTPPRPPKNEVFATWLRDRAMGLTPKMRLVFVREIPWKLMMIWGYPYDSGTPHMYPYVSLCIHMSFHFRMYRRYILVWVQNRWSNIWEHIAVVSWNLSGTSLQTATVHSGSMKRFCWWHFNSTSKGWRLT